jgi:hypothetical protein
MTRKARLWSLLLTLVVVFGVAGLQAELLPPPQCTPGEGICKICGCEHCPICPICCLGD